MSARRASTRLSSGWKVSSHAHVVVKALCAAREIVDAGARRAGVITRVGCGARLLVIAVNGKREDHGQLVRVNALDHGVEALRPRDGEGELVEKRVPRHTIVGNVDRDLKRRGRGGGV